MGWLKPPCRRADIAVVEVYLARQPIFDRALNLFGYELLYRSCAGGGFDAADSALASLPVLSNSLLGFGLDQLLKGKLGFVNFPRGLLVSDLVCTPPGKSIVVEILESVTPDDAVIAACQELKKKGYLIALDDVDPRTPSLRLANFADIIEVDFRATTPAERQMLVRRYGRPGVRMLAEKVETQEEFALAREERFGYFQGYFFARPVILSRKEIPVLKLNYLRLLAEIHRPELEFGQIEPLIKHEVSLCHRLLRYVNSAAFGLRVHVMSVQHALVLLGESDLRRWISLAALPVLASDKPDERVESAVVRARFCELIAPWAGLRERHAELFLMGMFSLLDAMVNRPLAEVLEELHLAQDVRDALLGTLEPANGLAYVYALALAYERADWDAAAMSAARLGAPSGAVSEAYLEAVKWSRQLFHEPGQA